MFCLVALGVFYFLFFREILSNSFTLCAVDSIVVLCVVSRRARARIVRRERRTLTTRRSSLPFQINRYMDKKLKLKLNGNRGVIGILRGFDQFLNLVLDECVKDSTAEKTPLGMVVVRGASVLSMEALEHIAPVQRKSTM